MRFKDSEVLGRLHLPYGVIGRDGSRRPLLVAQRDSLHEATTRAEEARRSFAEVWVVRLGDDGRLVEVDTGTGS